MNFENSLLTALFLHSFHFKCLFYAIKLLYYINYYDIIKFRKVYYKNILIFSIFKEDIFMENTVNNEVNNGMVNISDEVIASMAAHIAESVEGVSGMVGTVAGGVAEFLGMKSPTKGVKIVKEEDKVSLTLSIAVEYGSKIPDVAWEIQDKVKVEIETMTGLAVDVVNISVDAIFVAEDTLNEKVGKEEAEKKTEE